MTNVNFQPEGYTTVTAWVVTEDTAKLLDFITEVFDGVETGRVATEDGSIGHAEIRVGDTMLLAFDRRPDWPEMPSLLRIWVADSDATVEKAVKAGARVVTELSDAAWGDRGARIRDPFGNIWWIMSHVEDVSEEEVWTRMSAPGYAEQMETAQATLDAELTGRAGRSSRPINPA
ncbi:VOC family protein [Glycomyces sp. NPDC048151]|uniref:VOC family protein n=1 Tax=Glycomyces sp. NPDC048151 TaxID=3364002 RepID=UPI00371FF8EB